MRAVGIVESSGFVLADHVSANIPDRTSILNGHAAHVVEHIVPMHFKITDATKPNSVIAAGDIVLTDLNISDPRIRRQQSAVLGPAFFLITRKMAENEKSILAVLDCLFLSLELE